MLSKSALSRAVTQSKADIKSVSSEASDLITIMIDRMIHVLYPKDSSTHPVRVVDRVTKLYPDENNSHAWVEDILDSLPDEEYKKSNSIFPIDTIKRMVRVHAGNVSFDRDAELFAENVARLFLGRLLSGIVESQGALQSLEGHHIVDDLYNKNGLHLMGLDVAPLGPIEKISKDSHRSGKKRRSGSKRRSGNKKRCPSNKTPVRGFIRDGKRVKSYCRKK